MYQWSITNHRCLVSVGHRSEPVQPRLSARRDTSGCFLSLLIPTVVLDLKHALLIDSMSNVHHNIDSLWNHNNSYNDCCYLSTRTINSSQAVNRSITWRTFTMNRYHSWHALVSGCIHFKWITCTNMQHVSILCLERYYTISIHWSFLLFRNLSMRHL